MRVDELVDVVEVQKVVHEEQLVHVEEEQLVQLHLWPGVVEEEVRRRLELRGESSGGF